MQSGVVLITVFCVCVCFSICRQKPRNWRTPPCTWAWPPPNQRWRKEIHRQGRTRRISAASPSAKTRFRSQRWCAPPNSHRTVRHIGFASFPNPFPLLSPHFLSFLYSFISESGHKATNRINSADYTVKPKIIHIFDIFLLVWHYSSFMQARIAK